METGQGEGGGPTEQHRLVRHGYLAVMVFKEKHGKKSRQEEKSLRGNDEIFGKQQSGEDPERQGK